MKERRPLGNVLVATDFSAAATRAVERAGRLPVAPGAALTVLHVLPSGGRPEDRTEAERALGYAASVAADGAAHVGRKDLNVVPRLVEGTPFVEIIRGARASESALVVVGRHGERRFRELLLGSTAERVIRKGDTSTLVVATPPVTPYRRPLVAVDGSETSRRALALAWCLTDPSVQALEVIEAYEPIPESALRRSGFSGEDARRYRVETQRDVQAALDAFLVAGDAPPATSTVREGDARQVILDVAVQREADLLALGTHGRSGLAHVLLGSVAEAVIRGAWP